MRHRNIETSRWSRMAIGSLFERGKLEDWREFSRALRHDPALATETLVVCRYHDEHGSGALARVLVEHFHPQIAAPVSPKHAAP